MANNKYTLSDLVNAVNHVLGGTPDVGIAAAQIVNGAIQQFTMSYEWRWRQAPLSVPTVNAQTYVALPSDFTQLLVVKKAADATGAMEAKTLDVIYGARNSGSTSLTSGLWYALNWTPQAGLTVEPTPIMELYPTPTGVFNIVGVYLRQIPRLVNLTDVPDIPSAYHELLLVFCRAYAVLMETGEFGADYQLLQNMLPSFTAMDGKSMGHIGKYRGGLAPSSTGPSLPTSPLIGP